MIVQIIRFRIVKTDVGLNQRLRLEEKACLGILQNHLQKLADVQSIKSLPWFVTSRSMLGSSSSPATRVLGIIETSNTLNACNTVQTSHSGAVPGSRKNAKCVVGDHHTNSHKGFQGTGCSYVTIPSRCWWKKSRTRENLRQR